MTAENLIVVQETNDSATKSKASMEEVGYFNSKYSHVFFSGKSKRRAALINRGYFFRVYLIRKLIENIGNQQVSRNNKILILILGSGFDTTYFWLKNELGSLFQHCVVVEIDLPDVVQRKINILKGKFPTETENLKSLFNQRITCHSLNSQYHLVAGDLNYLTDLDFYFDKFFQLIFNANESFASIFLSECVLSYMEKEFSDSILEWLAKAHCFRSGPRHFLIYEQLLKTTSSTDPFDPFSRTMLSHFEKLQCPLFSSLPYSTIDSQRDRLIRFGWETVSIFPLNKWFYSFKEIISKDLLERISNIELFDEFEEWDLKLGRYFFAHASIDFTLDGKRVKSECYKPIPLEDKTFSPGPVPIKVFLKRWGHTVNVINGQNILFGGFGEGRACGTIKRLNDLEIINEDSLEMIKPSDDCSNPAPRLNHCSASWKDENGQEYLIIAGGRTRPDEILSDIWKFDPISKFWTRLYKSTKEGFYRSRAEIFSSRYLVIVGGFSSRGVRIFDLVKISWVEVHFEGMEEQEFHRFGFSLCKCSESHFLIIGGHSIVKSDRAPTFSNVLSFKITISCREQSCTITGRALNFYSNNLLLPRVKFHQAVVDHDTEGVYIIGGLSTDPGIFDTNDFGDYLPRQENMFLILDLLMLTWCRFYLFKNISKVPLLIRHKVCLERREGEKILYVFGGGATIFSMGTYYDKSYKIKINTTTTNFTRDHLICTIENNQVMKDLTGYVGKKQPFVIKNLNFGSCQTRWSNPDYLVSKCQEKLVSVHKCSEKVIMFAPTRNYTFEVMSFENFFILMRQNHTNPDTAIKNYYYFRAIGENPRKMVADFETSFPEIASDFQVPLDHFPQLKKPVDGGRWFSTVLRISSPGLILWTHYDIMDNILIHLGPKGVRRRVTLWRPTDLPYLYINGSSSIIPLTPKNIENHPDPLICKNFPLLTKSEPIIIEMAPGDCLFIPALWFHHVFCYSEEEEEQEQPSCNDSSSSFYAIAINLFWKSLPDHFYSKKDLYGNKDPLPAEEAIKALKEGLVSLGSLPEPFRQFYFLQMESVINEFKSLSKY